MDDGNQCDSDPCMNGATCLDLVKAFQCICPDNVISRLCETDVIDECISQPCLNGGNYIWVKLVHFEAAAFQSGHKNLRLLKIFLKG